MSKDRATMDRSAVGSVSDIMEKTSKRDEKAVNAKHGKPTTYRLPVELRDRFKAIAKAEGVNLSDLAQFVIMEFIAAYDAGTVELPKREQVTYTLDLDD